MSQIDVLKTLNISEMKFLNKTLLITFFKGHTSKLSYHTKFDINALFSQTLKMNTSLRKRFWTKMNFGKFLHVHVKDLWCVRNTCTLTD